MAAKSASPAATVATLIAVVALPLAGAVAAGHDYRTFLRFPPPLDIPAGYPHFSWVAFAAVVALIGAIGVSWCTTARRWPADRGPSSISATDGRRRGVTPPQTAARQFPIWGWLAVGWTAGWWVLAWNRFAWFADAQRYTFFPLWVGFIVTVNALVEYRAGTCLMRRATAKWLVLFLVSAGFWWLFEWLNRFVRNWHYLAVENFGAVEYAVHATLCFSTVLPAVTAVREWIGTFDGFDTRAARGPAWPWLAKPITGWMLIVGALAALGFTGARPQYTYAALWVAPLALAWGVRIVARRPGIAHEIGRGDWRSAAAWMLAALVCGFWWECWNWQSLAKWIYTVPYVDRWHVFEMPLLGYAGYLPFGLECLLVVERIAADREVAVASARANDCGAPARTSVAR